MIFRDMIYDVANRFSDRVAVICRKEDGITFRELHERSNALVAGLRDFGLGKGDKIAVLCGNCHHYRELFWTAGKGGFILVPVNARLKPGEMRYIIDNSEARYLVISEEFRDLVEEIRADLAYLDHFFSVDPGLEGYTYLGDFLSQYPRDDPEVDLSEEDLLWFQYTSGTTGLPKGAMLTQGIAASIVNIVYNAIKGKGLFKGETRALQLLPSYSFSSIAFDLIYQWIGAVTVLMDKFDPEEMMALIEKHRITDCHIVPVILNFILNAPKFGRYDLSSLECITYGASPMPPELLKRGIEKIGPIFMQDYGASEAGALTILDIEDHVIHGPPEKVARLASCGKPIPGCDVKVLNENGEEVRPGEIGELTVKSEMVMTGYWKMPEETKAVLVDGRFYTGDLCTVDEEGYIYIKDRKKDMIISGGFNIYPNEVENVLMEHPDILDAAVIGIPDEDWGEAVCGLVVLREGARLDEQAIIDFVKDRIASYKKPKRIEMVDQIPRTMTGKILKRQLREKYWEGRDRKV